MKSRDFSPTCNLGPEIQKKKIKKKTSIVILTDWGVLIALREDTNFLGKNCQSSLVLLQTICNLSARADLTFFFFENSPSSPQSTVI